MPILQADTAEQLAAIRTLFADYAAWLRVDLCFQGFNDELATLPGSYAPPQGRLLWQPLRRKRQDVWRYARLATQYAK